MADEGTKLEQRINDLMFTMEKMKLAEYVDYLHNTRLMLINNFLAGVARGFGMAVGFTILGAILVMILRNLVVFNLPLIGDFIAEIVRIVNTNL